ncbi:hypothetical protein SBD_3840 [Streptomyces bottropensis ATCC 25435]|uniref:Uncharacterized protein n=1 Tax=Streptomyces bottropensis ATCC 25435 TaxID=1054862 RepID=M3EDA9_9ACTN|nr:hypothetical protein SBD_3840 [Streptomyces bottropensis ATCC 25435]
MGYETGRLSPSRAKRVRRNVLGDLIGGMSVAPRGSRADRRGHTRATPRRRPGGSAPVSAPEPARAALSGTATVHLLLLTRLPRSR